MLLVALLGDGLLCIQFKGAKWDRAFRLVVAGPCRKPYSFRSPVECREAFFTVVSQLWPLFGPKYYSKQQGVMPHLRHSTTRRACRRRRVTPHKWAWRVAVTRTLDRIELRVTVRRSDWRPCRSLLPPSIGMGSRAARPALQGLIQTEPSLAVQGKENSGSSIGP